MTNPPNIDETIAWLEAEAAKPEHHKNSPHYGKTISIQSVQMSAAAQQLRQLRDALDGIQNTPPIDLHPEVLGDKTADWWRRLVRDMRDQARAALEGTL